MAPGPTPPHDPGAMTVPFLFGWEQIVTALLLVIGVAVLFFLIAAAGRNESERAEFQASLQARSLGRSPSVGTEGDGLPPS